jgi:hypothetical protein
MMMVLLRKIKTELMKLSRVLMKEKASKKAERDLIEEATSTMSK